MLQINDKPESTRGTLSFRKTNQEPDTESIILISRLQSQVQDLLFKQKDFQMQDEKIKVEKEHSRQLQDKIDTLSL